MRLSSIADILWGNRARVQYLLIAAAILLFTALGARDIWTQEHRWADIVAGMFYRHDFLHPYLGENRYYDKPLLSYWLIALIAQIWGQLTVWALRLPSALSGLLAIWSIYRLGTQLKNKELGLLSGWLLLTTFYFVFWARTSSADMLNLAGSLFAVAWYRDKRDCAGFIDYTIFFIILALTSLCKGLGGAIVPLIAVFVDVMMQGSWKRYLRPMILLSMVPAIIIYASPFIASSYWGGNEYGQSGLYLVYRENILRYFQPFDHQGPIYTYFVYLPIYTFPWALFFIPALVTIKSRWKTMNANSKWCALTLALLFVFFTASGSRRSYYVLPMVPFAILFTADWILAAASSAKRRLWSTATVLITFVLLLLAIDLIPAWYYSHYGVSRFAQQLQAEAGKTKAWSQWHVVMLDGESKLNFYLQLPPNTKHYGISGARASQTVESLLPHWPILSNKPADTIFITRKRYADLLQPYFTGYKLVTPSVSSPFFSFGGANDANAPVAFVPVEFE